MENFYRRVRMVEVAGIMLVGIIGTVIILRVQRKDSSQEKLPRYPNSLAHKKEFDKKILFLSILNGNINCRNIASRKI